MTKTDVENKMKEPVVANPQPVDPESTERASVTGVELVNDSAVAVPSELAKQGQKVCFGCCDSRRAVIIMDAIKLVLTIFSIISVLRSSGSDDEDDRGVEEVTIFSWERNAPLYDAPNSVYLVWGAVAIIGNILGISGAVQFNANLVLVASVYYVGSIIWFALHYSIFGVLEEIIWLHPHIVLFSEIKKGIMSEGTYAAREEYSCCCV